MAWDSSDVSSTWSATSSFRVDTVVPTITSTSPQQWVSSNSARVWAYGATDANGIAYVSVYAVRPDTTYYLLGNATKNGATNDYYFDVTDITIDGNWRYDFRAYDPAGNVSAIGYAYVFRDKVAPSQPTLTIGTVTGTSVALSWTAFSDAAPSSGVNGAVVYMRTFNGTAWVDIAGSGFYVGNVTSYTWTGLTPNTQYHAIVQWVDAAGNYSNYPELNFYTDVTPPTIGSIDPVAYTNVNTGTQRVNVQNVADNMGVNRTDFWYRKSTDGGSTWNAWSSPITGNKVGANWYYDVPKSGDGYYQVDARAYDNAGNVSNSNNPITTYFYVDTAQPATPSQVSGVLYATSNGVSWSAFSDGGALSSGLAATIVYLQMWNGSAYADVAGFPKSVTGTTYSFTGLTPNTSYRWGVVYQDMAGNASTISYANFVTNAYAATTVANLATAGSLLTQLPKIKFSVTDANSATLTDFTLQIASDSGFTTNLRSAQSSASSVGWGATSIPTGSSNTYTVQTALGTGTFYLRVRAFDGLDWGTWSTTIAFTIRAVSWATTLAVGDSAVSKRTIDDIRNQVNLVRQARGLAVASWTDPTIVDWNGVTPTQVRGIHLTEIRTAIASVYSAISVTVPTWTDAIIDTTINRKGSHWIDLRNAIAAI